MQGIFGLENWSDSAACAENAELGEMTDDAEQFFFLDLSDDYFAPYDAGSPDPGLACLSTVD
jgi:hypothetical protein